MKKENPTIHIIVVGDELLTGKILDTNSYFITAELAGLGMPPSSVSIVGDCKQHITAVLTEKMKTADVIILTGGLGPTPDDITRFAVAKALGRNLVTYQSQIKAIHNKLKTSTKTLKRISEIEACLPDGSRPLTNAVGIAPGFRIIQDGCTLFCIPGVPREARYIFNKAIKPYIMRTFRRRAVVHAVIKTIGLREAEITRRIKPHQFGNVAIGMYPQGREVALRLHAARAQRGKLVRITRMIHKKLADYIYSTHDESIEHVIGRCCIQKKLTLACAESCSGGLISKRITDIPGSSRYFRGTIIAYANMLKQGILGVSQKNLVRHGAVSSRVAREMLKGLIRITHADIGISVTGIAGPGGATRKKPVGLVYVGIYFKGRISVRSFHFSGDREKIRWLTSQAAMHEIWKRVR